MTLLTMDITNDIDLKVGLAVTAQTGLERVDQAFHGRPSFPISMLIKQQGVSSVCEYHVHGGPVV